MKGNDTIIGSYGNDAFYGYTGNDTFVGGLGVDTVAYDGALSQVTVSASGGGYKVSTFGKVDTLSGIERIALGDGSVLALDVKPGEAPAPLIASTSRHLIANPTWRASSPGSSKWMQVPF